jgi:hypothetical protein
MGDIVEHVARAIYEREPSYWEGHSTPWDKQREGKRDVIREDARAAIRATLEYLRENVSDAVGVAGGLKLEAIMFEDDSEGTGVIFNDVKPVFRAMISAALNDIEGGAG